MAKNTNLHAAKTAKNDEFYTRIEDIENELKHYKDHFEGKVVYCNCDDPLTSNFCRFFRLKFVDYKIKKLICTAYTKDQGNGTVYIWDKDINGNGILDDDEATPIKLQQNGDFRSPECIEYLKQADIVVTNPPFSLFREYVAQLVEYKKKFLIVGNGNAITYKEIFPLIKENKIWLAASRNIGQNFEFVVPNSYSGTSTRIDEKGVKYAKVANATWFTNLTHSKRNQKLTLYKKYDPKEFPKYDNYDAIEVSKVSDIPMDYDGVMGVPITFLDKYCPEQFEIVSFRKGEDGKDLVFTTERERESSTVLSYPCSTSIPGMIKNAEGKINGKPTYARITIRRKKNQ